MQPFLGIEILESRRLLSGPGSDSGRDDEDRSGSSGSDYGDRVDFGKDDKQQRGEDDKKGRFDDKDKHRRGGDDKHKSRHKKFEELEFKARLSGREEVPPRKTKATGEAEFELHKNGKLLKFELDVENIRNVVAAHIHLGKKGENGPIVVTLFEGPPGRGKFNGTLAKGVITAKDLEGPLAGKSLSDLVNLMKKGMTYVNVHTDDGKDPPNTGPGDFPGGEIRGQIFLKHSRFAFHFDKKIDFGDKKLVET